MPANDILNPDALNSTIEFLTAMVTPALPCSYACQFDGWLMRKRPERAV